MKIARVILRLAALLLAAPAFVGLTGIYGGSVGTPLPDPRWQEGRRHRPSAPNGRQFPELVGEVVILAIYAVAGRIVFRLRLSPPSRSEGQPILLRLDRESKDCQVVS